MRVAAAALVGLTAAIALGLAASLPAVEFVAAGSGIVGLVIASVALLEAW